MALDGNDASAARLVFQSNESQDQGPPASETSATGSVVGARSCSPLSWGMFTRLSSEEDDGDIMMEDLEPAEASKGTC